MLFKILFNELAYANFAIRESKIMFLVSILIIVLVEIKLIDG